MILLCLMTLGSISRQFCNERRELLDKREALIKEVMIEGRRRGGYAGEYTNQNVYAYVIARKQSRDLELLSRWGSGNLSTIHLLTGNFEELYMYSSRRESGRVWKTQEYYWIICQAD